MGEYCEAIESLHKGLDIAKQINLREDEAKIHHRLGLALWIQGHFEEAQQELYSAIELFENIRHESPFNNDLKISLFDLQTASYQVLQVCCHV